MAYELAGSRILTPVVGSSDYIWTSIIGVIIAAMSIGYWLGGKWADRRGKTIDIAIILLTCAALVVATLVVADFVLAGASQLGDQRLQAVFVSLVLFAPASVLLGAVSPYLARMHTKTLSETGRSIATLSALNSIGGILGTFMVGFVFFGYIGSRETLVIIAALLGVSGFLLLGEVAVKRKIALIAAAIVILLMMIFIASRNSDVIASIETPTNSYLVQDITYEGEPVRVLTMGPEGLQSAVRRDGSKEPVFTYVKKMAAMVAQLNAPKRILVLGGGTFTLPEHFGLTYPEAQIDAVEIDPQLESIAVRYFDYSSPENVTIFAEDARTFVRNSHQKYDVIITDAYSDTGVPFSLVTAEFAREVSELLAPNGVLLMNVIGGEKSACQPLTYSIFASFSSRLTGVVVPIEAGQSLEERQNIIFAFARSDDAARLERFDGRRLETGDTRAFTDNFAPVERMDQQCKAAN